jgi:hypothetical protein
MNKEVPHLVALDHFLDEKGLLEVSELDFPINRIYMLSNVPLGEVRGLHAHKTLRQLILSTCGSFDISLTDGIHEYLFNLKCEGPAVLIPPGFWRVLKNFSPESKCLVLASSHYEEDDYIYDFQEFIDWKLSTNA